MVQAVGAQTHEDATSPTTADLVLGDAGSVAVEASPVATASARPSAWKRRVAAAGLGLMLVLGMAVRVHNASDSPFSFHATRQFHSALVARTIYLDRTRPASDPERRAADAVFANESKLEAPITEHLVATVYQVAGHEDLRLANAWCAFVWVVGAAILLRIATRFASTAGQFTALAVYLFLPFAVAGGRTFQPDVLMVTLILAMALLALRHDEAPTRWRLVAVGAAAGAAVLVKPMAAPMVLVVFAALAIRRRGLVRGLLGVDSWMFGALTVAPIAISTVAGANWTGSGDGAADYFVPSLLGQAHFYRDWLQIVTENVGWPALLLGIVGLVVARGTARALLAALWIGYVVTALLVDYRTITHSYYHLELVGLLALGSALAMDAAITWARANAPTVLRMSRMPVVLLLLIAIGAAWVQRPDLSELGGPQARITADRDAASVTGMGARVASVSHSYGRDLAYYGNVVVVSELPSVDDLALLRLQGRPDPTARQSLRRAHVDWVVVTAPDSMGPDLRTELDAHYRLAGHGNGWMVYDLRHRH
ncbi:MAG: hypothetical protein JWM89_1387 [Acidimicrobiales bacterium]|nr:hypothetical protein [Acidimicrobiales bacterium]